MTLGSVEQSEIARGFRGGNKTIMAQVLWTTNNPSKETDYDNDDQPS